MTSKFQISAEICEKMAPEYSKLKITPLHETGSLINSCDDFMSNSVGK